MESSLSFIHQYPLGPMANFVYIIEDIETKEVAIVDPAWDVPYLCRVIQEKGYILSKILLTHGHHDHVNGLDALLQVHDVPVYLSNQEHAAYTPEISQLILVADNAIIHIGNQAVRCLHTPGHTPGGMCFLIADQLITGDTLFIDGCGRTDLLGSDVNAMYESLQRLMQLPDHIKVYPGHDYGQVSYDTLGNQKKQNRFLLSKDRETFIRKRTAR